MVEFVGILVVALVAVGTLLAARWRWFGRIHRGFGLMLAMALAGAGVATAVAVGTWGYEAARAMCIGQRVQGLTDVSRVAEEQLGREIETACTKLENVASAELIERAGKRPEDAREELTRLMTFNRRLLQINVVDRDGKVLVSTLANGQQSEETNHVGTANALDGRTYVSEPYVSKVFGRETIYVSVPAKAKGGAVVGAVTLRCDLQQIMAETMGRVKFGQTGRVIVSDAKGRVMAHPQADQVGSDVSAGPAFKAAESVDGVGWKILRTSDGVDRLLVFEKVKTPATDSDARVIVLAEMEAAEALAPVWRMERTFAMVSAGVAGVWAILAWVLAGYLTRPVRELEAAAKKVEAGDLQTRVELVGNDEIGQCAAAFNAMVAGLRERDRVKQVFGRYVTQQVAEKILRSDDKLGGTKKRVTILFADIRNFTTMSEEMTPEKVVEFLNEYFSEMVDAVFEHGGVLDKFIGDGMMAVFGAVDDLPEPEKRAVKAGLRMKAKLAKINGQRAIDGRPPIDIGIGIHTDEVVVGNIGSKDRQDYTVIGDGVNTCSRVESANKELGTTLLVTQQTYEMLGDEFLCRAMPAAKLKGKEKALALFEVVSALAA